jgi:Immunoglobulin-like domain of bacterial spore germination
MAKYFLGAAAAVVFLFLAATAVLSSCHDDWCLIFQWQKARASQSFADCARFGFPVQESYPRRCSTGTRTFTEPISAEFAGPTESQNIKVTSPQPGEKVTSPISLKGEGRVFESVVSYRLKDASGHVVTSGTVTAAAPDAGQFGPFEKLIGFSNVQGSSLTLEVFQVSAKDGSDSDKVTIKLRL